MKYLQQIYESLIRGAFLSANTTREDAQNWYKDVIDNLEDYKCFFAKIGYRLAFSVAFCGALHFPQLKRAISSFRRRQTAVHRKYFLQVCALCLQAFLLSYSALLCQKNFFILRI